MNSFAYFGSPNIVDSLKGKVFLSPSMKIASIFCIPRHQIMKEYLRKNNINLSSWNLGYDEFIISGSDVDMSPLEHVTIRHNVNSTIIEEGESIGFIHKINIRDKDHLIHHHLNYSLDLEMIYEGDKELPILEVHRHTIKWTLRRR